MRVKIFAEMETPVDEQVSRTDYATITLDNESILTLANAIKSAQTTKEDDVKDSNNIPTWVDFIEGEWGADDLRRAFVMGAKWWEFHKNGATMFQSDRWITEKRAEYIFPNGKPPSKNTITQADIEAQADRMNGES